MSAFTEEALNELLAKNQGDEIQEDDADLTPPDNPISQQGDIWLLGKHRLICGDSTKAETHRISYLPCCHFVSFRQFPHMRRYTAGL